MDLVIQLNALREAVASNVASNVVPSVLSKHESRLAQIRLMVEEIQERQKLDGHAGAQGMHYEAANEFLRKVALLVDRPFLHKPQFDPDRQHTEK